VRLRLLCACAWSAYHLYVTAEREREREREARRGTDATRTGDTTGEDPAHRGPTQRGGPCRGPTTGGEGHTGDPHRTHTDNCHLFWRLPPDCHLVCVTHNMGLEGSHGLQSYWCVLIYNDRYSPKVRCALKGFGFEFPILRTMKL